MKECALCGSDRPATHTRPPHRWYRNNRGEWFCCDAHRRKSAQNLLKFLMGNNQIAFECRVSGFDTLVYWGQTPAGVRYQCRKAAHEAGFYSIDFKDITVYRARKFDEMGPPTHGQSELLTLAQGRLLKWRTS